MQYTVEIEIQLPRARAVELFDDLENRVKWQEGLLSCTPVDGPPGEVGAQSKLVFQMGKRTIEMTETITARNLPDEYNATYETPGVFNAVENRFVEVGTEKTRWESYNVFEFQGFMKLVGFFAKGAFPKQSRKYMEAFKAFAEDGTDVRNASR